MNRYIRRWELTKSRDFNIWYFALYCQPKFGFQIIINKWNVGIWIFGIGIAFEKHPF